MIGHWIAFGALFPLIAVGIIGFKNWSKRFIKTEITPEMEKAANIKVIKYILFYWLCNLFYMSCFIDNLVCQYVFGVLIMIVIFTNLAEAFTYPKERTSLEKWGLLQDFLLGIGLSIYLIYIIPDYDLRVIVIPVVAAVYGGLITLVGVGWTIRKSDQDRKEELIQKNRPFVFIVNRKRKQTENLVKFKFEKLFADTKVFDKGDQYFIDYFIVKNPDFSFSALKGLCINNDIIAMSIAQVFDKGHIYKCQCDLEFNYSGTIDKIYLLLEDMLDNHYALELNCKFVKTAKEKRIQILSGIELFRAKVDFNKCKMSIDIK